MNRRRTLLIAGTLVALSATRSGAVPAESGPLIPPAPAECPAGAPQRSTGAKPNYYPEQAAGTNITGAVRMKCRVTACGLLEKCEVISEDPTGYGFGKAALGMSKLFKMRTVTRDGRPVGGSKIIIPMKFQPPPTVPAAGTAQSGEQK